MTLSSLVLVFTVRSTIDNFASWLELHTVAWDDRILPLSNGEVAILSPFDRCMMARQKWAWCKWDIGVVPWHLGRGESKELPNGTYEHSGVAKQMPPLVVVSAQDKGNGEIELHMDCSRSPVCPPFATVFAGLLHEIAEAWSESRPKINDYLKGLGVEGVSAGPEQEVRSGDDRQRLEDSDRWDWIIEKVGEYEGFLNNGLSQTGAARKVKNAEGHPIPRSTLNGWRTRVRKKQGDDLAS